MSEEVLEKTQVKEPKIKHTGDWEEVDMTIELREEDHPNTDFGFDKVEGEDDNGSEQGFLERQLGYYEEKFNKLQSDNESMVFLLSDMKDEVDLWKHKYNDSLSKIEGLVLAIKTLK